MIRKTPGPRKRRTRQHVIAEMGVNYVERLILKRGFSLERIVHDYGIDAMLFTYGKDGETNNAWIPMQIKATDRIRFAGQGRYISIRVERSDLRSWLFHLFPVILVVYDAKEDRAFWVYLQAYFGTSRFKASSGDGTVTIRIPTKQKLNSKAMDKIVSYRDAVTKQVQEGVEHHD